MTAVSVGWTTGRQSRVSKFRAMVSRAVRVVESAPESSVAVSSTLGCAKQDSGEAVLVSQLIGRHVRRYRRRAAVGLVARRKGSGDRRARWRPFLRRGLSREPAATNGNGDGDGSASMIVDREAGYGAAPPRRPAFSDRFIAHMLTRNIRIEEDLVDQLFNSSEKRLARTLLLLARYGNPKSSHRVLPRSLRKPSPRWSARRAHASTSSLNKFTVGLFIEYNGGLKINDFAAERGPARLKRNRRCRFRRTPDCGTETPSSPVMS